MDSAWADEVNHLFVLSSIFIDEMWQLNVILGKETCPCEEIKFPLWCGDPISSKCLLSSLFFGNWCILFDN